MSNIHVGGELYEKWHTKPIPAKEGDRIRFRFKPPKASSLTEKTGTITHVHEENNVTVDVDDAGKWRLKYGAVLIIQESRSDRTHGTLIDVEKIPQVGMKAIAERDVEKEGAWDKPIVGEVTEVDLENDTVRFQREFDPTNLPVRFEELTEVK